MKINYRNTALHFLDDPKQIQFYIPANNHFKSEKGERAFGKSVQVAIAQGVEGYKQNVQYISNPFHHAYHVGRHKLINVFDTVSFNQAGTLIYSKGSWTTTCFYMLVTEGLGENWRMKIALVYFSKHAKNDFFSLEAVITEDTFSEDGETKTFFSKTYEDVGLTRVPLESEIIGLFTFLQFCQLETKVIEGGRKGYHAGEKYVNETKHKVEILDSSWFTTIIRSEGFNVGGHFRMQPYGPANALRKLIWISPFEKDGYTRTAKIITNNEG